MTEARRMAATPSEMEAADYAADRDALRAALATVTGDNRRLRAALEEAVPVLRVMRLLPLAARLQSALDGAGDG